MIIKEIINKYPFAEDYFIDNGLNIENYKNYTISELVNNLSDEFFEEKATDAENIINDFNNYINAMKEFLGINEDNNIESLTIIAGRNKFQEKENFIELKINKSEIISIVGPTGSGKSRLLQDIEWMAQKDTPTERMILINNKVPDLRKRYSGNNKLVAQLSQNMNFVMDLKVREFLKLHAESRFVEDTEFIADKIIFEANKLAGEKFNEYTDITSLSGGQSRALMIADTAILSSSPIVLIDEIENAGIDRKKALNLLVSEDKIVLMATHDPTLALMSDRRIVINNGGIINIIKTTEEEKNLLKELEYFNNKFSEMRKSLRYGELLNNINLY